LKKYANETRDMKLCYLADATNVHTQKWVSYFVRQGHEVDVITFLDHAIPGAKVHHFKPPLGFNLFEERTLRGKLSYLALIPSIRRLVHQLKPDIVHAHRETSYGLMGAMAGYHPFILSAWGPEVQWQAKDNKVYRAMIRFNLSKADVITATSVNLTKDTKAFSPPATPLFTVPFGVECDLFRPIESVRVVKRPLTVGTVKRLEEECGIHDLIAAVALIKPRLPETRLMIVGEGSYRDTLKAQVRSLGLEGSVIFTGWVENAQLPYIMNEFDVFGLPSYPRTESFGVAVLEALACGTPVVAINDGGPAELIREDVTGYLVSPRSPAAMADALYKLLSNEERRLQMAHNGRQFVLEHYQWKDNAALMARIYERVLSGALQ
jgi:glycosyltransferase involved in cell wall biosynthesis